MEEGQAKKRKESTVMPLAWDACQFICCKTAVNENLVQQYRKTAKDFSFHNISTTRIHQDGGHLEK